MAEKNEFFFSRKFSVGQVFDCQRSPATPVAGKVFKASSFKMPYKSAGGQFTKSELEGRWFQFAYENSTGKVALYLFSADEPGLEKKVGSGNIYGIGEKGFLFVSNYGYFIADEACYFEGENVSYTPTSDKATLEQLTELLMAHTGVFARKFGCAQVFDCQRSPAYPEVGKKISLSGLNMPCNSKGQMKQSELTDRYFQFKYDATTDKVALYQFKSDGSEGVKISSGYIYGLDDLGFLYEGDGHYGYFFPRVSGYYYGNSVNYIPVIGKASIEQLENYPC